MGDEPSVGAVVRERVANLLGDSKQAAGSDGSYGERAAGCDGSDIERVNLLRQAPRCYVRSKHFMNIGPYSGSAG